MARPEVTRPRFLSKDVEKALRSVVLDLKATGKAVDLLIEYEDLQPPEKPINSDEPALLRFLDLNVDNVAAHVGLLKLPEAFYDYLHPDHIDWTSGEVMSYIDRGGLTDPKTGRVYGGYSGVLRVLVIAHLITKTIQWGLGQPTTTENSYIDFNGHLPQVVTELTAWTANAITRSLNRNTGNKKVSLPTKSRRSLWIPNSIITHRSSGPDSTDEAGWFRYEPVIFQQYIGGSIKETARVLELEGSDRNQSMGFNDIIAKDRVEDCVVEKTPGGGNTTADNIINMSSSSSSDSASAATRLRPITVEGATNLSAPKLIDSKRSIDSQPTLTATSDNAAPVLQPVSEENLNSEAQHTGATMQIIEARAPSETANQPPPDPVDVPPPVAASDAGPPSGKHRRTSSSVSSRATTRRITTYGATTRRAPSGSPAPSVAGSSRAASISRDNYLTRATQHVASTRQGMNVSSALAASVVPSRRKEKKTRQQDNMDDQDAQE
ncbi:hypothetical protein RhiJN_27183 [Ceratobasidium sp. AG-Ba]|nr:hypothetical protein RhiJN_27183 [Ceratobasidium sp. AG-Ba]